VRAARLQMPSKRLGAYIKNIEHIAQAWICNSNKGTV